LISKYQNKIKAKKAEDNSNNINNFNKNLSNKNLGGGLNKNENLTFYNKKVNETKPKIIIPFKKEDKILKTE
jgi:hypothetical protein